MYQDRNGVYKLYSFLKGSVNESEKYGKDPISEACKGKPKKNKKIKTKKKKTKTKESKTNEEVAMIDVGGRKMFYSELEDKAKIAEDFGDFVKLVGAQTESEVDRAKHWWEQNMGRIEEKHINVSDTKQILFTYAYDGFWVKDMDDNKNFVGGRKNIEEFGIPEKTIKKAIENSGTWVDAVAEKIIKEMEDSYTDEEIESMHDFSLPGDRENADLLGVKKDLEEKYGLYDYHWEDGYHYFVFDNKENMVNAINYVKDAYNLVAEARIKIGEKKYKLRIRREDG